MKLLYIYHSLLVLFGIKIFKCWTRLTYRPRRYGHGARCHGLLEPFLGSPLDHSRAPQGGEEGERRWRRQAEASAGAMAAAGHRQPPPDRDGRPARAPHHGRPGAPARRAAHVAQARRGPRRRRVVRRRRQGDHQDARRRVRDTAGAPPSGA